MTTTARARDAILRLLDDQRAPAGLREALPGLADDQTLMLSGDALTIASTSPVAPRLIADRRVVLRPRADVAGLATGLSAAAGDLRGRLVLIAGWGDGAWARAVTAAGGHSLTIEVDPARGAHDLPRVDSLDEAARQAAAGQSTVMAGNIVGVAEAMVRRGFTPDVLLDPLGERRVPEKYAPLATRVLAARNPLELARVQLQSRERLNIALRTLGERGAVAVACPRDDRFDWLDLDRDALETSAPPTPEVLSDLLSREHVRAPIAVRFARRGSGALGTTLDAARGAAYVDLAGGAIFVADSVAAATFGIKHWTSANS